MKGKELRIGNLVNFNGNHEEVGVISEILKNDLTKVSPYKIGINHRTDIYYDINKLKPIPLTEEWLVKFGLKKNNGCPYKFLNGFIKIRNEVYFYKYYHLDIELKSVHQLQNLYFALTNTEL